MCKSISSIFILFTLFLVACQSPEETKKNREISNLEVFDIPSSIRALTIVDSDKYRNAKGNIEVWYAGSRGQYGYTEDMGAHWIMDSLKLTNDSTAHFRSIAKNKHNTFLLSVDRPANLFQSNNRGETWKLAYEEDVPGVFYDAMTFWDDKEGIAIGDPTDDCMSVILTRSSGFAWKKVPCEKLPPVMDGEAAFAASNSNIAVHGNHAWFVTGGQRARVFHSPDRGLSWEVFDTPIKQGGQMTGIFSVDFWDEKNGIIFGGDWEDKENNFSNKAITSDGGKTWQLISDGNGPGYRSCVKYFPDGNGQEIIAVGSPGISVSNDAGQTWNQISDESFYTIQFDESGRHTWLAGDQKVARLIWK